MPRHRPRPGRSTVIVTDQRHRGGKVKRLPQPGQGPDQHQPHQPAAPPGGQRKKAPHHTRQNDQPLPRVTVRRNPRHRCRRRVNPCEGRQDPTRLNIIKMELILQKRHDGTDRLPVRIIEKADHPKHPHNEPGIMSQIPVDSSHGQPLAGVTIFEHDESVAFGPPELKAYYRAFPDRGAIRARW